jgi:protein-tyrosine phosphatase
MRALLLFASAAAFVCASPALADIVEKAAVERVSPTAVVVRWTDKDPVDVLVSEKPDASGDAAKLVSRADKDGEQQLAAPASERLYVLLRDTRSGRTVRVAERLLPLEQGSNFRDLGGYPAADGKHVRWGLIYRSGGTPMLSEADLAEIRGLGLAHMVDLRSSEERVLAPSRITGVPYTAIGYSMTTMMPMDPAAMAQQSRTGGLYRQMPVFLAQHLRIVFADLLSGDGPLVYNCSAGQDRTGFVTAMILSALGVPRETIIEDYHLSTAYRRPEYEMPKIDLAAFPGNPVAAMFARGQEHPGVRKAMPLKTADGAPYLGQAFAAIDERWGSVDAYLEKEIGLTPADIAKLRALYLE